AAHALESGARPEWVEPLAETLYLLAQDIAVPESTAVHVVLPGPWDEAADTAAPRPPPMLPRQGLAVQLQEALAERERLARRVTRLEEEIAKKDQELAELNQELERIKKMLRP